MRLFTIARKSVCPWAAAGLLAGILLFGLAGCWRPTAQLPPQPPQLTVAPVAAPEEPPPPPVEPPTEVAVTPSEPAPAEPPAVPAPPPIPAEKMLLLAPQGPILVEFEIWIDGQPQTQVFDQLLDEVTKLADTDGDGTPTWKEVTTSPRFKYGQFGNLPIDRENAPKQIIQQYDLNGNGLVDRTELPRFLTRNAGGARAFSVRSIEQFHNRNRRGSPTWRALDSDDDGAISPAELRAAAAQLKLNDADDDEILLVDELRPTSEVDPNGNLRTRGQLGDFARLLGPHANWDSVRSALEQQYAGGKNVSREHFHAMGEMFDQIDADQDGKLSKKEFPAINDIPPHLRFRIDFGVPKPEPAKEPGPAPTSLQLLSSRLTPQQTGAAQPQTIEYSGRLILRWPGVSLTFVRNDTIAAIDYDAQAQQGLTMYDTDKNGYLEEKELNEMAQAQFARFDALDTDDDKRIYPGEIATFLRQRQGAQRAQVHARAQDQEDALYQALDQNADDRLDARELETAAERLLTLDGNQDGQLTGDELPTGLAVVIARGSIENPNQLFAVSPVEVRPVATNLPSWFTAMDTSRDGVISAREFLGPAAKFAELDKNRNGFFEPEEIPPGLGGTKPAEKPAELPAETAAEGTGP